MEIKVGLEGINQAFKLMEQAPTKTAKSGTDDLAQGVRDQSKVKVPLEANISVLKNAMGMQESIIDILA